MFPYAHVYTLAIHPEALSNFITAHPTNTLHTSTSQYIPGLFRDGIYISIIKLYSWIYWEFLNLKQFSLIISSSHSFGAKAVNKSKSAFHISYIHTPPKYLYNEYSEWRNIKQFPLSFLLAPILFFLRLIDKLSANKPDVLIANSKEVQKRIQRYYHRNSIVIYPPATTTHIVDKSQKKYYLFLSRLSKQKGIKLAVDTCTQYNIPLKIVGSGTLLKILKKYAGSTITFYGPCKENEKIKLYRGAKALLYPAIDEDFGITPAEAMSYGTSVIAYNSGGIRETVIPHKTGVLFDDYSINGLKKALDEFATSRFFPRTCQLWSQRFSKGTFRKKLLQHIPRKFYRN